jgi:hypothetical protein
LNKTIVPITNLKVKPIRAIMIFAVEVIIRVNLKLVDKLKAWFLAGLECIENTYKKYFYKLHEVKDETKYV